MKNSSRSLQPPSAKLPPNDNQPLASAGEPERNVFTAQENETAEKRQTEKSQSKEVSNDAIEKGLEGAKNADKSEKREKEEEMKNEERKGEESKEEDKKINDKLSDDKKVDDTNDERKEKSEHEKERDTNNNVKFDKKTTSKSDRRQKSSTRSGKLKKGKPDDITISPTVMEWTENFEEQALNITNSGNLTFAIKMRCSDNDVFIMKPVFTKVEPGKTGTIRIFRKEAKLKSDRIVIVATELTTAAETEKEIQQFFKSCDHDVHELVLPLEAKKE